MIKLTGVLGFTVAVVLVGLPFAGARSDYFLVVGEQLKLKSDKTFNTAGCQYCHQSKFGGAPWNKFGDGVREAFFGDARRDISEALYLVLKAGKDSDGDGVKDVLEVIAKTLPGDAKSKPTKPVATLEAELKAMGGVEVFKKK